MVHSLKDANIDSDAMPPAQKPYCEKIQELIGPQDRVAGIACGPSLAYELHALDFSELLVYDIRRFNQEDLDRRLQGDSTHKEELDETYKDKLAYGYFENSFLTKIPFGQFIGEELCRLGATDITSYDSGVYFSWNNKPRKVDYFCVNTSKGTILEQPGEINAYFEKSTFESSNFFKNMFPQIRPFLADEAHVLVGKRVGDSRNLDLRSDIHKALSKGNLFGVAKISDDDFYDSLYDVQSGLWSFRFMQDLRLFFDDMNIEYGGRLITHRLTRH